jgi:hypothetical protein
MNEVNHLDVSNGNPCELCGSRVKLDGPELRERFVDDGGYCDGCLEIMDFLREIEMILNANPS